LIAGRLDDEVLKGAVILIRIDAMDALVLDAAEGLFQPLPGEQNFSNLSVIRNIDF
jgi:hypothetical protein